MAILTESHKKSEGYVTNQLTEFPSKRTLSVVIPPRKLLARNLSTFTKIEGQSLYHQIYRHYMQRFLQLISAHAENEREFFSISDLLFYFNFNERARTTVKSKYRTNNYEYVMESPDTERLLLETHSSGYEWLFSEVGYTIGEDQSLNVWMKLAAYPLGSPQTLDINHPLHQIVFDFDYIYLDRDIKLTRFDIHSRLNGAKKPTTLTGNPATFHSFHYSWILDMFHSLFVETSSVRPTQAQTTLRDNWYKPFSMWLEIIGVDQSPVQMAFNSMRSSFAFRMLFDGIDAENPAIVNDFFIQAFLNPRAKVIGAKLAVDSGSSRHHYVDLALSPALFSSETFFLDSFAHEMAGNLDEHLHSVFIPMVKSPLFVKVFSSLWKRLLRTSDHMIYFANDRVAQEINTMDPSWPAFDHLQYEVFLEDKPTVIHWNSTSPNPHYPIATSENWSQAAQFVMYNTCLLTYLYGHSKSEISQMIETIAESYTPQGRSFAWMANLLRFLCSTEDLPSRFSNEKKRRFYLQVMNFVATAADDFEYQQSCQIVVDIISMWSQLPQTLRDQIEIRKVRNITDLHQICSLTLSKVKNPEYPIDNPAATPILGNAEIPDLPYLLVLPKTNQDVIQWGAIQHHCLGTYATKAAKNEKIIVGVRDTTDNSWFAHMMLSQNGDKWKLDQFLRARNTAVPEPQRSLLLEHVLTLVNHQNGEKV